jgi:broad specificity phosphatase PhoE/ribonuclease HI
LTSASPRSVIVEADGGSRGNPGPAAYGALLKDAETGELIAERGETIVIATNNVAEYRGLIAGLELAAEHAPEAEIEVRMDSKLVVEQMSGNWKIKHPDMKPLAMQANRLAPFGTTFTWVPRAENAHADRLANEALDGMRDATGLTDPPVGPAPSASARPVRSHSRSGTAPEKQPRGWGPPGATPTTLVMVRHGVTNATIGKLFSGGLASTNPPLNDEGRDQARATGEWLAPLADTFDALVTSPVRRTRETAEVLAKFLDLEITEEPAIAEMEFGTWDGLSFTEVREKWPDELSAWLGDVDSAPHGGESFRVVEKRVLEGKDRLLAAYAGKTVVLVSHVTPIKTLVAEALGAPLDSVFRMELAPASVSVISYFNVGAEGEIPMASLRLYNARPMDVFG